MRATAMALTAILVAGCSDRLKPGRCDSDSDCASGETCSQEMMAGVYHRCLAVDAGADAMGATDATDGADVVAPECTNDRQCPAERPVCGVGGVCGACAVGVGQVCATHHGTKPVCGPMGACVECAASADCPGNAKPVCDLISFVCASCKADGDCAGRPGPGVCMGHQDGRCASEAETIYVQQGPSCTSVADPTGGNAGMPFCGLDKAAVALSPTRRLFVVRGTVQGTAWTLQGAAGDPQVSIVGQQSATIAGGASPGLRIVTANVYARDLRVTRSVDVGISASSGSLVRMERVAVDNNGGGGILLSASSFEIRNVHVSENGPGTLGLATWGGIAVQDQPSTGPALLDLVTVDLNKAPGISCTSAIAGTGVSALNNSAIDISPTCGITSCGARSATCGAM